MFGLKTFNLNHHLMKNILKITSMLAISALTFACGSGQQKEEAATVQEESPAKAESNDGFIKIFDGESLNGWDGDATYWRVENGAIVGEITEETKLERNHFIIYQGGQPADFEFKAEFKITEAGNSGVNYRSEPVEGLAHALKGYQADIDGKNNYTGQNYEERKEQHLHTLVNKPKSTLKKKKATSEPMWRKMLGLA